MALSSKLFAVDLGNSLERKLDNLYVFQPRDAAGTILNPDRLSILVTFDRHEQSQSIKEVFMSQHRKISIFISTGSELRVTKSVDFHFGGENQYAVFISAMEPIVGALGEVTVRNDMKVYAGLRDDPSFLDFSAYKGWKQSPCVPVKGLRCEEGDSPVNAYANASTAMVAVELPIALLINDLTTKSGKFNVWAKMYVAK